MTPCQRTATETPRQDSFPWTRLEAAQARADFLDRHNPFASQRAFAEHHGIPRSTLGHWLRQQDPTDVDAELASFLRGPAGEVFLQRLVLAAVLVFHQHAACGLRQISLFLQHSQLDRFVGSSYGALHNLADRLQADLADFGVLERQRMAGLMTPRQIALTGDENFHGEHPCLVAIEPVSDFIVVETYSERRDAQTWSEAITKATADLPVTVVALTSDQAKGLIACAGQLDAQYTPELFHGQRDLARGLFAALRRVISAKEKELEQAKERVRHAAAQKEKAQQRQPRPGQPTDQEWRLLQAQDEQQCIAKQLEDEQQWHKQAKDALRGLADDYHPFDARTGQPLTVEQVKQRLEQRHATLEKVAIVTGLTDRMDEELSKGSKWITALVASMAWFWSMARGRLEELALPEEAEKVVQEKLLAGLYWEQAARRGRTVQDRKHQKELAERLLSEAWAKEGPLTRLSQSDQKQVQAVAREVIGLFSRSSSCVEGRNGRLALHHHGHTRLSEGRLKALGVVHNYLVRRLDGSTAAERFFGVPQRDAFAWLLERMPELPRPAAKRTKPHVSPMHKAG
jgi:hypothetical protein